MVSSCILKAALTTQNPKFVRNLCSRLVESRFNSFGCKEKDGRRIGCTFLSETSLYLQFSQIYSNASDYFKKAKEVNQIDEINRKTLLILKIVN